MTITVPLPQGGYPIHIRRGLLARSGPLLAALPCRRWAVAADETAAALYGGTVLESIRQAGLEVRLLTFPAGERHKTPETCLALCRQLAQLGFTRSDGLLALGGGVTGDLAGFAAACYQRGMTLAHAPTTLLAQVDSAVGGKTAVDLPEGKNLLGTFYQPRLVLVDPDCLATLPERELRCGAAEVIKYGMIRDSAILDLLACAAPDWESLTARCLTVKASLVAADERDTGVRRLLNFGHTFGHAYEAAGGFSRYTHGETVAAGMAAMLRWQTGRGDAGAAEACRRLLPLLEQYGLPVSLPVAGETLRRYLARDKKCEGDIVHAVLLRKAGDAYVEDVPLSALWEVTP